MGSYLGSDQAVADKGPDCSVAWIMRTARRNTKVGVRRIVSEGTPEPVVVCRSIGDRQISMDGKGGVRGVQTAMDIRAMSLHRP